jgi:hypothetical protein
MKIFRLIKFVSPLLLFLFLLCSFSQPGEHKTSDKKVCLTFTKKEKPYSENSTDQVPFEENEEENEKEGERESEAKRKTEDEGFSLFVAQLIYEHAHITLLFSPTVNNSSFALRFESLHIPLFLAVRNLRV